MCDTDSPQDTPQVKTCHHLLMFSLRQLLFSLCSLKTENLRQKLGGKIGQLEAEKLNLGGSIFVGRLVEMVMHAMRMVNNTRKNETHATVELEREASSVSCPFKVRKRTVKRTNIRRGRWRRRYRHNCSCRSHVP